MNHANTTSAKRNSGRNSTLTGSDRHTLRRVVSENHRTTAAQVTAELNIRFEDPVSTKLSVMRFTNPTSTAGLQLLNPRLLKVILRCVNDGVTTIKPGHKTTGNTRWSEESSFTLFHISGRVYVHLENIKGNLQSGMPVSNSETGGRSVMVWTVISWYSILPILLLPFIDVHRLGNEVLPMNQTLFQKNDAVFQDDNALIHTAGTVQS
jgi:hypothetical protein